MSDGTKIPRGWKAVRQQLAAWDKPALLVLVQELYDAAGVNRDLVDARCHPEEAFSGATLEKYRGKIVQQFFPSRGFGALKLGEARKTIRDYRKGYQQSSRNGGIADDLRGKRDEIHPRVWRYQRAVLPTAWSPPCKNWRTCCAPRRGICIHK